MTGLPRVTITLVNGQLGGTVATADGVAGLIATGIATGELALNTPKAYFTLEEVEADGFTADYDTDNDSDVYRHAAAFYDRVGAGELWLIVVANTTTMTQMVANTVTSAAGKLLAEANGRVRLLGVTRRPAGTYAAVVTEGIDPDVSAAVVAAHTLALAWTAKYQPVRVVIEGRAFTGVVGDLRNNREGTQNRVLVVLGNDRPDATAFVGLVLGALAALPVQRKISRVKNGEIGITEAYLSNGASIRTFSDAVGGAQDALHDKGYVFARRFVGKNGYFFSSDPTCTTTADDYSSFARGRVIDKAILLSYGVLVDELEDDVDVDAATGRLAAGVVKALQSRIEEVVTAEMVVRGEASGVQCLISTAQNIITTGVLAVRLRVIPKGYSTYITEDLGFAIQTQ